MTHAALFPGGELEGRGLGLPLAQCYAATLGAQLQLDPAPARDCAAAFQLVLQLYFDPADKGSAH